MPLPQVPTVVHELELPGRNMKIQFRPFLMKEYKALLQAREFADEAGFARTIRIILKACTFEKLDIDELPIFLVDYIFLMIRAKSIGEIIEADYICNKLIEVNEDKEDEDKEETGEPKFAECGTKIRVGLDLTKTFIRYPENYNTKSVIKLDDKVGLKLKSPIFGRFRSITEKTTDIFDLTDSYVFACIDCVYDGDKILLPEKDFSFEEVKEFFASFPTKAINQITEFFNNQPTVSLDLTIKCPKCGNEEEVHLNGLDDFFV